MAEMASLWAYEDHNDVEQLGQKLLYTTLELENLKAEARDQNMKNNEYVKQLIQLIKLAIYERDEARLQFQKLQSFYQPDSPAVKTGGKSNSSITESGSFTSPVDSVFDGVSSPEFSNFVGGARPFVQETNAHTVPVPKNDEGMMVIENIAKGRVLPQKGKLMQAVLGAGPLLQTLLVAGPLPTWRNPPQVQPFQNIAQKPALRTMSFGNAASGICFSNGSMNGNGYGPLMKRQRFC